MTGTLPLVLLLSSLLPACIILLLPETAWWTRAAVNLAGALVNLALVGIMLAGVIDGRQFEFRWALVPGLDLLLRVDALALLFVTLSAFLWLLTTIYAIAYLGEAPDQARFFGFFSLCVAATMGIALAGIADHLLRLLRDADALDLAAGGPSGRCGLDASRGAPISRYTTRRRAVLLLGDRAAGGTAGPVEFTAAWRLAGLADRAAARRSSCFCRAGSG